MDFKQIPDTLLVPGTYQEIDNSLAGTTSTAKKILLVGLVLENAKAKECEVIRVTNAVKAAEHFGYGSQLAIMVENFYNVNKESDIELYALPVLGSGIAYEETFTVALKTAESGSIYVAINEKTATVNYSKSDTAESIAALVVASINSIFNSPVSASSKVIESEDKNEVTLTVVSLAKGLEGIRVSFEAEGVSFTSKNKIDAKYTPIADWSKYFEALGNVRYNYFVLGMEDVDGLKAWSKELEDRYSAIRQISGRLFSYLSGNVGDITEEKSIIGKASKVNSPHIVILPYTDIVALPCGFITKIAITAINKLASDPAANTYYLEVKDLEALKEIATKEREELLQSGVATWIIDHEGNVRIERLVTSYTKNADGAKDTSYLDVQIVETVDAIRDYINNEARKRFGSWKLANTEEYFGSGSKVMTPAVFKSFLAELYKTIFIEEKQWAEDFDSYNKSIKVEVKKDSKTRLEYMHSPILIGQFYQACGLNQFR